MKNRRLAVAGSICALAVSGVVGGLAGQALLSESAAAATPVEVTPAQLLINQRISQAAVKRANAIKEAMVKPQTISIAAAAMVSRCVSGNACVQGAPGSLVTAPDGAILSAPVDLPVGATITKIEIVGIDPIDPQVLISRLQGCIRAVHPDRTEAVAVGEKGAGRGCAGLSGASVKLETGSSPVNAKVEAGVAYQASISIPKVTPSTDIPAGTAAAMVRITYKPAPPF